MAYVVLKRPILLMVSRALGPCRTTQGLCGAQRPVLRRGRVPRPIQDEAVNVAYVVLKRPHPPHGEPGP